MRRTTLLAISALLALSSAVGHADEPVVALGSESPESAAWDPDSQAWYVSSKGGTGFEQQGGFISKVSSSGELLATRWFDQVDSPFGVAAHDGRLYAADLQALRVIDIASASLLATVPIPGAGGLNDVAVDPATGDVYLSDSAANRVYRVSMAGEPVADVFVEGGELDFPNGLLVEGDRLIVGTFGLQAGLRGRLFAVDLASRAITPMTEPFAAIDGIARAGEHLYVTDFINGRLLRVASDGSTELVMPLLPTAADLGSDPIRGVLAIPITAAHLTHFVAP